MNHNKVAETKPPMGPQHQVAKYLLTTEINESIKKDNILESNEIDLVVLSDEQLKGESEDLDLPSLETSSELDPFEVVTNTDNSQPTDMEVESKHKIKVTEFSRH